jgi:hypothetical protein
MEAVDEWEDLDDWDTENTDILDMFGDMDPYSPDTDQYELDAAMDYIIDCIGYESSRKVKAKAMAQLSDLAEDLHQCTLSDNNPWIEVKDGDHRLLMVFRDHYSYRQPQGKRKNNLVIGPGYKLPLIVPHATKPLTGRPQAIFAWRLEKYRRDGEYGACCAFFRNESNLQASNLIRAAEEHAMKRWPYIERLFTHIDPAKVKPTMRRGRPTWGYVYEKAGWSILNQRTKRNNLLRLDKTKAAPGWLFAWNYTANERTRVTLKQMTLL